MPLFLRCTVLTLDSAYFFTRALLAVALTLQGFELLALNKIYSRGPWEWSLIREDFRSQSILLRLFDIIHSKIAFTGASIVQIVVSLFLIKVPSFAGVFTLVLIQLLIASRFRGAFNGGADAMVLVLLTGLAISAWSPRMVEVGLLYVAVFATFSYAASAISKLKNRSWWSGEALRSYALDSSYDVPASLMNLFKRPRLSFVLSWSLLLFELALPFCLLNEQAIALWIGLGLLFHLTTFAAIGLNRFFWVWIASYPALFYFVIR